MYAFLNTKSERQSNIELLRILSAIGVIILHYNNAGIGGGFLYVKPLSLNYFFLNFLESLCICAVNIFILITGYFMCTSQKRNIAKPLKLLIQLILFSMGIYFGIVIVEKVPFSFRFFVEYLIPNNYFIILYIALYFISFYFNVLIQHLDKRQFRTMLIVLLLIFSVWNTVAYFIEEALGHELLGLSTIGMYGSQFGYTIVNFSLMYFLGAYIRLHYDREDNKLILVGLLLLNIVVLMVCTTITDYLNSSLIDAVWAYCNPLVIFETVIIFLIFRGIKMKSHKILNFFATGTISVYLLHTSLLKYIQIEKFVTGNAFLMLVHIFISCILIYLACFIVHVAYEFIMMPIHKLIDKSKNLNL